MWFVWLYLSSSSIASHRGDTGPTVIGLVLGVSMYYALAHHHMFDNNDSLQFSAMARARRDPYSVGVQFLASLNRDGRCPGCDGQAPVAK
jgi:hypothetical protein